jgi:hypothetical protein
MKAPLPPAVVCVLWFALAVATRAAESAPLAYWPFDGELTDAGGGGVVLIDPYRKLDYVPGVVGQAIAFAWEKRDYLRTVKHDQLPMEGDFTVSAWFKAAEGPTRDAVQGIVGRWAYDGQAHFDVRLVGFRNGPQVVALLTTDGTKLIELKHPSPVDFDGWYHIALVYRAASKTATLHLSSRSDKALDAGEPKTLDAPLHSEVKTPFTVGFSQLGGCFFNGVVDEVVVWDKALSPKDLGDVFARGKEGKPALGGKL